VSFAPGYRAPETFPGEECAAISAELRASRDAHGLQ